MKDEPTKEIQAAKEANSRLLFPAEAIRKLKEPLEAFKPFRGMDSLFRQLQQNVAAWVEAYRDIAEAHQEIDNGLTKAIEFWEKRNPEVAAVYREFRDALRDTTPFNIPEAFMDGTTTARIRAMARRRRGKRDKLAGEVRAKARELQTKRPRSQRALRAYLARNSEGFFGEKLSESTIRRYIEKAGDT